MSQFGRSVDRVCGWIDLQRLDTAVMKRLPSNRATVGRVDEAWVKVSDSPGLDYRDWFKTMARELREEEEVTGSSSDYIAGNDNAGRSRQKFPVHTKRTLGRAGLRLGKVMRDCNDELLDQIAKTVANLSSDGSALAAEMVQT